MKPTVGTPSSLNLRTRVLKPFTSMVTAWSSAPPRRAWACFSVTAGIFAFGSMWISLIESGFSLLAATTAGHVWVRPSPGVIASVFPSRSLTVRMLVSSSETTA